MRGAATGLPATLVLIFTDRAPPIEEALVSVVGVSAHSGAPGPKRFPKIELHVHLEGTVRARTLLQIARRNNVPLPADSVAGLAGLYQYQDFAHFLEVWRLTTGALRTERDFRQVVVDYAAEAASYGAVYIEGIFTPAEPAGRGCDWDEVFTGYCDGAQQAAEQHGVHVRLTPTSRARTRWRWRS